MTSVEAFAALRALGTEVLETRTAATVLRQSPSATTRTLGRLAEVGLVTRIRHGVWWLGDAPRPWTLVATLTAPFDSYLSLQSALHLRGMIEQIPAVYYVVTQSRSQRIDTAVGTFSVHHIAPVLFGGYELLGGSAPGLPGDAPVATAEKALFDVAWLSAGRSRRFTGLPELELPAGFRELELDRWVNRIPSARGRTLVRRKLDVWLARSS